MDSQGGLSLKLFESVVVFFAGAALFQFLTESSKWVASLVGLALWTLLMYAVPPRPKLWKLILGAALLAILVVSLHLLHFG